MELLLEILKRQETMKYMEMLKRHHKETYEHSLRVSLRCINLGFRNSLPGEEIELLGYAGLLHDIGKLDIPIEILSNSFPLTEREKKIVISHPRIGFLKLKSPVFEDVRKIVIAHHEYQANPYPRNRQNSQNIVEKIGFECRREKCEKISYLTQIVAITDMYDALISKRAYNKTIGRQEAEGIMKENFTGNRSYINLVLGSN